MAFLHGSPDKIELGKSESTEEAQKKLADFRSKVKARKHVKHWTSPEDLAGKVALTFANFQKTYPAVGWIRGDVQTATDSLVELNELRKQLEAAERRLEEARSGPPPGTERLAQAADEVGFEAKAKTSVRSDNSPLGREWTGTMEVDATWDEVFSAIGPELLDESSQYAMRRSVDRWLTTRYGGEFRKLTRKAAKEQGEQVHSFRGTRIELPDDHFGTVLIQLRALGLLSRSERKRSVTDKGTYWTLTPYGDEHLTSLRAISRDGQIASDDGDDLDADEEQDE
jgi:hypothetical protein